MKSKMVFLIFVLAFGVIFSGNAEAAENEQHSERSSKGLSLVKPVGGVLKGVTKTVGNTVKETTDTVEATTGGLTETVNQTVSETTDVVKETGSAVTETVRATTNEVAKVPAVKPVADTVNKVVEPTLAVVDETLSTTTETVNTTVQETTSTVNQAVEATGNLVGDVSDTASETVQATVDETVDVVDKVTEPVREVVKKPLPKPAEKPQPEESNKPKPQETVKTEPQQTEKPRPQDPELQKPKPQEPAKEPNQDIQQPQPEKVVKPDVKQPDAESESGEQSKPDMPTRNVETEATIKIPAQQVKPVVTDKQETRMQAAEILDTKKEPTAAFIIEEIIKQESTEKHMNHDSKMQLRQDNRKTVGSFVKELVNQKARFDQESFDGKTVASVTKPIEKQQDQEEIFKEWERSFVAQPPAQPQQSATVIHGGVMGGGLSAILGDSIMTGLQLIDQWTSQADYLSNQWVHAPPGQPPKFSPFLLSRI